MHVINNVCNIYSTNIASDPGVIYRGFQFDHTSVSELSWVLFFAADSLAFPFRAGGGVGFLGSVSESALLR